MNCVNKAILTAHYHFGFKFVVNRRMMHTQFRIKYVLGWFMFLVLIISLPDTLSSQSDNPFDVQGREKATIEQVTIPEKTQKSPEKKVSIFEKKEQEKLGQNPFNVSHIPIKRQKKQEVHKQNKTFTASEPSALQDTIRSFLPNNESESSGNIKFVFWLFLLQLLLIVSVLGMNREFLYKIRRSISNDNFAKLVGRDYNNGASPLFLILYLLYIISLSIFIYLIVRKLNNISGVQSYFLIFIGVCVVYLGRHLFLSVMGFVFPFTKTISYYNFMIILFNGYLGLLLIPINIVLAYSPETFANLSFYIGIFLVVLFYLLRLVRGTLHAYTLIRSHILHFFLYLCTCEIAPIFILIKYLSNSFT